MSIVRSLESRYSAEEEEGGGREAPIMGICWRLLARPFNHWISSAWKLLTQWSKFLEQEVRESAALFVAPPRVFSPLPSDFHAQISNIFYINLHT